MYIPFDVQFGLIGENGLEQHKNQKYKFARNQKVTFVGLYLNSSEIYVENGTVMLAANYA